jgi:flagellar hook-associated protein 1
MSLDAALGIASSGLLAVQRALAQASANVSNASTAGYTAKTVSTQARTIGNAPAGVLSGEAQRSVDQALLRQIGASTSDQAAAALREGLLQGIEGAYGAVSDADSTSNLSDEMSALRNAFITLQGSPDDSALQRAAVTAASTVASRFNTVGQALGQARQDAQDTIVSQVATVNATLRQIGGLTQQIQQAMQLGQSTADLEDQRDQAVQTLAASIEVKAVPQADGGLLLMTAGGAMLPTDPNRDALATSPATVSPGAFYGSGGTLPGITLNGVDITQRLTGGILGAAITMRDVTLPRDQAELDTAAAQLAYRFDQEGLTLFTTSSGAVPDPTQPYTSGGQLGFANLIQVNSAVTANPALVRDGTRSVSTATGGVTNFTPNPTGGPAGFSDLIDNIVNFTFSANAATGLAWAPVATTGLGPDGSLNSSFNAPASVQDYAAAVMATQTADSAAATSAKSQAASLLATLQQRFNTQSGVDVDAEMTSMIRLQQAYAANAKVVSTVQQMWDALLGAVQ